MTISVEMVKKLRDWTGLGIMDCKRALIETDGDMDKAVELLRKRGLADADKRAGRKTSEGRVGAYIHPPGRLGVMVELNCETDFVAKSDAFSDLLHDLCLHVAAARPAAVRREDVPADVIEREREIYRAQVQGKPEPIQAKIIDSKMDSWFKDHVLLEQPFVKDPKTTVADCIKATIAKVGENITVGRVTRLAVGQQEE